MTCSECEKIKEKKNLIYEDELVIAMLAEKPSSAGHIVLLPKPHFTIIEQIPDNIVSHLFSIANKLSVACFEVLGSHGTNILISNGVSAGQKANHTMINIIPRQENDGLSFHWQTIKPTEDELSTQQLTIQSELEKPMEEKKEEKKVEVKEEIIEETDDENYMIRQLERIP